MKKPRVRKTRNENIYDTLTNSEWFIKECNSVREKYIDSQNDEMYLKTEVNRLSKYLPAYWEGCIREYIKTGNLKMPTIEGARVVYNQNSETGERELFIQVFKKTTQDDIKKIWPTVEFFQKWLKEIWSPEISDTNMNVLKIWEEVESRERKPKILAREVSALLYERHSINLAESTITKIVSDMRKQLHAVKKTSKK